jgi:protein SPT2
MAGEAVPSHLLWTRLTTQFTSLMETASDAQSEAARRLARLRETQRLEAARRQELDLAAKEREKQERWSKALENHEKQAKVEKQPTKPVAMPPKPKVLQPVRQPSPKKITNMKQRSMTFKKLLKQAAKIDSSTFKVGPKVKIQPKAPEKVRQTVTHSVKIDAKTPLPSRPVALKPASPASRKPLERTLSSSSRSVSPQKVSRPQKSVLERTMTSAARSVSPPYKKTAISKTSKLTPPVKSVPLKSGGKDARSRIRDSFIPNELIPLAQGPKKDLRTIEQIQNDLWRKKGKNYPSVTGNVKEPTRKPITPSTTSAKAPLPTKKVAEAPKKRRRESDSVTEDSFIASSEEEIAVPEKFDYRAEIRAMFGRKGNTRIIHSDDDSDMEATGLEMAREEARAAKLARLEDEEEERRLEDRARDKKRRKLEAEKRKHGK